MSRDSLVSALRGDAEARAERAKAERAMVELAQARQAMRERLAELRARLGYLRAAREARPESEHYIRGSERDRLTGEIEATEAAIKAVRSAVGE